MDMPVNPEDYEKNESLYDQSRLVAEEIVRELEEAFHIDVYKRQVWRTNFTMRSAACLRTR